MNRKSSSLRARLLQIGLATSLACDDAERREVSTGTVGAADGGSAGAAGASGTSGIAGAAGQPGTGGAAGSIWIGGAPAAPVEPVVCDGYPPTPLLPSGKFDCGDSPDASSCALVCYPKGDSSAPCLALGDPNFPKKSDFYYPECGLHEITSGPHCSLEGEAKYKDGPLCCYLGIYMVCIGRPLVVASALRQAPLLRRLW